MSGVALNFLREAGGGVTLRLILGFGVNALMGRAADFTVSVLLTLALVTGGYALASMFGTSGPLTMVAGLIIGNRFHIQPDRKYLDAYWNITDDLLNAALFVLIGLEVLLIPFSSASLIAAVVAICITSKVMIASSTYSPSSPSSSSCSSLGSYATP